MSRGKTFLLILRLYPVEDIKYHRHLFFFQFSLRQSSVCLTSMHKKVCFEVFFLKRWVVPGECSVFLDRPVTWSTSRMSGEKTAVVLSHIRNIHEWISHFNPNVTNLCDETRPHKPHVGVLSVQSWHSTYMLLRLHVGLQDAFASWALSIYE